VSDSEIREAYEKAREIVQLHEDPKHKSDERVHPFLPDVSQTTGDRIMAIVSMRIDGYSDNKIAGLIGVKSPYINTLMKTKPKAFAAAEAHALKSAARKYEINLWGVRAALSRYCMDAVDTLHELMRDSKTPQHIRRSCAVDILNLSGAGYTRQTTGGRDTRIYATQINNNLKEVLDDRFIDNIVDAVVVEETTDEQISRVDSP
jgi:hypothetical protein